MAFPKSIAALLLVATGMLAHAPTTHAEEALTVLSVRIVSITVDQVYDGPFGGNLEVIFDFAVNDNPTQRWSYNDLGRGTTYINKTFVGVVATRHLYIRSTGVERDVGDEDPLPLADGYFYPPTFGEGAIRSLARVSNPSITYTLNVEIKRQPLPNLSVRDASSFEQVQTVRPECLKPFPPADCDEDPFGSVTNGVIRFPVCLSGPINRSVTVQAWTSDGTARAPDDYVAIPQASPRTVAFAPLEHGCRLADVPLEADSVTEADEFFHLNLSNPTVVAIADGQGVGTIQDGVG